MHEEHSSLPCLVLGHDWSDGFTLTNPLGRSVNGDLCARCGKFRIRGKGKAEWPSSGENESQIA